MRGCLRRRLTKLRPAARSFGRIHCTMRLRLERCLFAEGRMRSIIVAVRWPPSLALPLVQDSARIANAMGRDPRGSARRCPGQHGLPQRMRHPDAAHRLRRARAGPEYGEYQPGRPKVALSRRAAGRRGWCLPVPGAHTVFGHEVMWGVKRTSSIVDVCISSLTTSREISHAAYGTAI